MSSAAFLKFGACRGLASKEQRPSRGGERDVLFFPRSEKKQSSDPAKAICDLCPVETECLDYAIENNERFGVWGGMSEGERRRERSRRLKESA